MAHFTQIRFKNYKAFSEYIVSLKSFNVLVGPNNAGKSTILGAFRILSEGIRRARLKAPTPVEGIAGKTHGYIVPLENLPVSTENVFHNYNDGEPAVVTFQISNGGILKLHFLERGACVLTAESVYTIRKPSEFKHQFPVTVAFVPVLGPVEHDEELHQEETARLALLSHNASRNFRNIWHHFPEYFEEFSEAVKRTWPGLDIERPEVDRTGPKARLHMFCLEERFPRELYWAGFGFQVWCQMLTFILQAKTSSLLIIDEPDIYLHADLQRQLIGILRTLGPDIVLATHSTEIISEVEPDMLLNINKRFRFSKRVQNSQELQDIFQFLGSNLNPVLNQLAKTRRVAFIEGKDYQIILRFARKLGYSEVANRSEFAVIPVDGFDAEKVKSFSEGMEAALGASFVYSAIFDRQYRSGGEADDILRALRKMRVYATIHRCKDLENYLLHPAAIFRAIQARIAERQKRGEATKPFTGDVDQMLLKITDELRNSAASQFVANRKNYERSKGDFDETTIIARVTSEFALQWADPTTRIAIVPGKAVLAALNSELQAHSQVHLTPSQIIEAFSVQEVDSEMIELVKCLDELRKRKIGEEEV